jgi:hypothetical protein
VSVHSYPSLIFLGKARNLPLKWSPAKGFTRVSFWSKFTGEARNLPFESLVKGSARVGSSLARKY